MNRVTQHSIAERSLRNMQVNLSRLGQLQDQLSSGKQITRPSDDPTGTSSALTMRAELRANTQWQRNAQDGLSWLGMIDDTLTGSLGSVNRVRDLALQGSSTGTSSQESREALAQEVDQLRQALLAGANTSYLGRPIFGGTTTGSTAYDATGAYVGDNATVARTVGPGGTAVRVDVTGPEVFGPAGADLFTTLSDISAHLRGDTTQLAGDITRLDALSSGLRSQLADVGARYNRIQQTQQALTDRELVVKTNLSDIEDVDVPEAIMNLQLANTAYQAALGATSKSIQPSLMDFLR